jgi:hypothetical protein
MDGVAGAFGQVRKMRPCEHCKRYLLQGDGAEFNELWSERESAALGLSQPVGLAQEGDQAMGGGARSADLPRDLMHVGRAPCHGSQDGQSARQGLGAEMPLRRLVFGIGIAVKRDGLEHLK